MRYFPKKKGIHFLFLRSRFGRAYKTPFYVACEKYGREEVLKSIEKVLVDCSNNPYDTAEALVLAAINDEIDLDCVFFLLRREPDVLAKLL